MDEAKANHFGARTRVLQHKDYDKNFVTRKCWKETGVDIHGKKLLPSLIKLLFGCSSFSLQGTDQAFSL
jgi:hypothetical protein